MCRPVSCCNLSGEAVKIGVAVKNALAVDDRVCGLLFGEDPDELDNGC